MSSKSIVVLTFAMLFGSVSAWPQASTGSVTGAVRDRGKAVIPGTAVALANTATNASAQKSTNEVGFYLFPAVQPGQYRLTIEHPGMQKFEANPNSVGGDGILSKQSSGNSARELQLTLRLIW